jgi:hypothetical protein
MIPRAPTSTSVKKCSMRRVVLLLAASVALAPVACGSTHRFTTDSEVFSAVDGDTLHVVVEREVSVAEPTLPGPCPKSRSHVERTLVYQMTYRLTNPSSKPVTSAVQDVTDRINAKDGEYAGEPHGRLYADLFKLPRTASLYSQLDPSIVSLNGAVPEPEAKQLRELGFAFDHDIVYRDMPDGRWYLGFDTFANRVQVCCPSRKILRERELKANWSMIWDVANSRVLVFGDWLSSRGPVIGLADSVKVWNYQTDVVTEYGLPSAIASGGR